MRRVLVLAGMMCGLLLGAPAAASAEAGPATLTPDRWSFHAQPYGTTESVTATLTVRCWSEDGDSSDPCDVPGAVNSITLEKPDDPVYTITENTCPATPFTVDSPTPLTCTFKLNFAPVEDERSGDGTIVTVDTDGQTDRILDVYGRGVHDGTPTLSPSGLSFGDQTVGTASATQAAQLTAGCAGYEGDGFPDGTGIVCYGAPTVTAVTVPAGYTQTNDCVGGPYQYTECTIEVAFSPGAAGPTPGAVLAVTVDDDQNLNDGTYTIPLSGNGVAPATDPPAGGGQSPATGAPARKAKKKCKKGKKKKRSAGAAKKCGKKRRR
jgi:hypothetical protein